MEFNRVKKGVSGSVPDFGAIFMSNRSTKEECFKKKLFGFPHAYANFVKKVKSGMVLFLFEYEQRKLYGVFEATTDGAVDIVPHAYRSSGKQFSAQVRIGTIWYCHPLSECDFRDAIKDNYFAANRFNFGLSRDQVHRLLCLFDSRKRRIQKNQSLFTESEVTKRSHKSLGKRRVMEKGRSIATESSGKKRNTDIVIEPVVDIELPHSNLNPLANSESQHWLSFGDRIATCKLPESSPCDCPYDPDTPGFQYSSVFGTSHSSTDLGDYIPLPSPDHSDSTESKNLDISSSSFTTDLGDYIPLPSPDHSDPTETGFPFSEADFFENNQVESESEMDPMPVLSGGSFRRENIDRPFVAISPERGPCHQGDCRLKDGAPHLESRSMDRQEHSDSDYDYDYPTVKGLYSDTLNKRSSVFSRLNFASKSVVQENQDNTRVDRSVHDIMEKLQKRADNWWKTTREA